MNNAREKLQWCCCNICMSNPVPNRQMVIVTMAWPDGMLQLQLWRAWPKTSGIHLQDT